MPDNHIARREQPQEQLNQLERRNRELERVIMREAALDDQIDEIDAMLTERSAKRAIGMAVNARDEAAGDMYSLSKADTLINGFLQRSLSRADRRRS